MISRADLRKDYNRVRCRFCRTTFKVKRDQ